MSATPIHKTHRLYIAIDKKDTTLNAFLTYFRIYEIDAPVIIRDSKGGVYEVDDACGFDLGYEAEWLIIERNSAYPDFDGQQINVKIQAGVGGRFVDGRLKTSALGSKIEVIPHELPTWTRLIPPIRNGVENPVISSNQEHSASLLTGATIQIATQDPAAIVRRIRAVINRETGSATTPGVLYVRIGSDKGPVIRRIVMDRNFDGESSPYGVAKFKTQPRTGYAEVRGGDALFVSLVGSMGSMKSVVYLHIEEEYKAEFPRALPAPINTADATLPPEVPTVVNVAPSDLQPIISGIDKIIEKLDPPTTVAETTIVGDPKLCPWPSVPVFVDGSGKWWEIQGAYIGDGYYDVMDDSYNTKNVFVPAASVQCQEMTRMETTLVEGGTTVVP